MTVLLRLDGPDLVACRESGDGDIKFPRVFGGLRNRMDRVDVDGVWDVSEFACDCEEGMIAMIIEDLNVEVKVGK